MRVLVTGATGFVGSHLTEALLGSGAQVRALVRRPDRLGWLEGLDRLEIVPGSLEDPASLERAVAGSDAIFHAAGLVKARTSSDYFAVNAQGTKNLLQAVEAKTDSLYRFVYISSQAAAGPSTLDRLRDENAAPHPITPYGWSKLEGERAVLARSRRMPITIIRPPAVFGPRDRDIFLYFKMAASGWIPIPGLGPRKVALIYVEDLVQGILKAAGSLKSVGRCYFISGGNYDWSELTTALKKAVGKGRPIRLPSWVLFGAALICESFSILSRKPAALNRHKARELTQRAWLCSASRAEQDFDFQSTWPLEKAMEKTARWYRDEGWIKE